MKRVLSDTSFRGKHGKAMVKPLTGTNLWEGGAVSQHKNILNKMMDFLKTRNRITC